MEEKPVSRKSAFQNFYLLFLFSAFFLSVGMESLGHKQTRMFLTAVFIGICFLPFKRIKEIRSPSVFAFGAVFLFEMIRAFLPAGIRSHFPLPSESAHLYVTALIPWGLYFFGFAAAYVCFNRKSAVLHLMTLNAVMCFLLSINIIFPLYRTGKAYYAFQGREYFFQPIFYIHEWVEKFILAPYCHPNRLGDILAIGFFSALGILCYFLFQLRQRARAEQNYERKISRREWEMGAFIVLFALVTGVVILLLFSRGTIASVVLVFMGSFFVIALKFPSKEQWALLGGVLLISLLFFLWAGNLTSAWKEVRSLEAENQVRSNDLNKTEYKSRSIFMNQEGARRALKIHEDYPLWGVGTQGYKLISKEYSSKGDYENLKNPDYAAWSHYFQLLAEEGSGAYLYFLFLLVYLGEWTAGMIRTKSQFKFIAALSLAAPVFVILIHASIIETMQRFTVAMPVYLLMGASLAVLHKNFQHEA